MPHRGIPGIRRGSKSDRCCRGTLRHDQAGLDNAQIKADFNELYKQMNGMTLHEMDQILDPVCSLCRGHQRAGFVEGVKVGIRLNAESRN